MATFGRFLQCSDREKRIRKDVRRIVKNRPPTYMLDFPKDVPHLPVTDKTVYIRVGDELATVPKMDWYAFRLLSAEPIGVKKNKRGKGAAVEKAWEIDPISENAKTRWSSCCVSLGSTIYCMGGYEKGGDSAQRVITFTEARGRWSKVTPMKGGRMDAHAVTADGKIYVFGGLLDDCKDGPEIEVFDPIRNSWESVEGTPVPVNYLYDTFVTYDEVGKKIFCGSDSDKLLLSYDLTEGGGGGS